MLHRVNFYILKIFQVLPNKTAQNHSDGNSSHLERNDGKLKNAIEKTTKEIKKITMPLKKYFLMSFLSNL